MFGVYTNRLKMRLGLIASISLSIGIATLLSANASAATLSKEECHGFEKEKNWMLRSGIADILNKGPVWAKANLNSTKMTVLERYLDVSDWLELRCPVEFSQSYKIAMEKKRQAELAKNKVKETLDRSVASMKHDQGVGAPSKSTTAIESPYQLAPMGIGAQETKMPPMPSRKE